MSAAFAEIFHDHQPQVGPEGCGKATLLRHCFSRLQRRGGVAVAEVHCSAATGAAQVLDKLVQVGGATQLCVRVVTRPSARTSVGQRSLQAEKPLSPPACAPSKLDQRLRLLAWSTSPPRG